MIVSYIRPQTKITRHVGEQRVTGLLFYDNPPVDEDYYYAMSCV